MSLQNADRLRRVPLVSREELDAVTHGKPLFMVKYDGHACVVNTALLKKLPRKTKKLRGYHADSGRFRFHHQLHLPAGAAARHADGGGL